MFQNEVFAHNNSIDFALWKCHKIWLSDTSSNVVLFFKIDMKNKIQSSTMSHFQHVFNNDFISQLCCFFMSVLDGKQIWIKLKNQLNDNVKSDYF